MPIGASHHQKTVIIDDAVAFSGGLDLTIRRWDTPEHRPDHPLRKDPQGKPYPPFHDVQMMIDGSAAVSLAALARQRWLRATGEELEAPCEVRETPDPNPRHDPWPASVKPDFTNVVIGIARTEPDCGDAPEIREVEHLFHDMVRAAERSIYVESQFLTALPLAKTVVERLRQRPELQVAIVMPRTHESWLEQQTMLAGRQRWEQYIREAGAADSVRFLYPNVRHGGTDTPVMVHSKVMIVDDRLLRIGSANLCNRSMAVDSECDLVVEATGQGDRAAIARVRDSLLGEHCGATPDEVAAALKQKGSLFGALDALGGRDRSLCPIADAPPDPSDLTAPIEAIGDPEKPIATAAYLGDLAVEPGRPGRLSVIVKACLAIFIVVALVSAWRFTPLADVLQPELVVEALARTPMGPLVFASAIGIFVVAGLMAFPLNLLIVGTAAAFGPWTGFAVAATGALSSALVTYAVGRWLGADVLRQVFGPGINRIRSKIADWGFVTITAIRLVPVAPFTLVNLVAGAIGVPLVHYTAGTLLGLTPGLIIMSALGAKTLDLLRHPTLEHILLFAGLLLVWAALAFGMQALARRFSNRFVGRSARRDSSEVSVAR